MLGIDPRRRASGRFFVGPAFPPLSWGMRWPHALRGLLAAALLSLPTTAWAAPSEEVLRTAAEHTAAAVEAHKAHEWEKAAEHGLAALPVLVEQFGWGNQELVKVIGVVTVDALMKLGRTAEADAILDQLKAAQKPEPNAQAKPEPQSEAKADPQTKALEVFASAYLAFVEGRYDEAVELGADGVAKMEAVAPGAPALPQMRSMLAVLYAQRLEYGKSDGLLEKNLAQAKSAGDVPGQVEWTNALAGSQLRQGKPAAAKGSFQAALGQARAAGDATGQAAAESGLGDVASAEGDSKTAIVHYRAALAQQEQRDQIGASHLVNPLHSLGVELELSGKFEEAQTVLTRAEAIATRSFGGQTPGSWNARSSLGRLYRSKRDYPRAIKIFEGILSEQEQALEPISPLIAATMNHLAETLWAQGGAPKRTIGLATRAAEIHEATMAGVLRSGSESQKRAYLERYTTGTDRILSYAIDYVPGDQDAIRLAAATALRRKGRLLDAVSDQLATLREHADADSAAKLQRLAQAQAQLSALVLRGPDEALPKDKHSALVQSLRQEVEGLQEALADLVPADERGTVQLEDVRAQLGEDDVLVEWVSYQPFDVHYADMNSAFGEPHYAAFVIHKTGPISVVKLGDAKRIDDGIVAFRKAVANPRSDPRALGRQLYGWVMEEVAAAAKGKEHVFVSPDGMLNLLPFAALVDGKNRYLVEKTRFTYLSSGRDLLRLQTHTMSGSDAVLVGSPSFSASGGAGSSGRRSAGLSDVMFTPLPGTAAEVDAIGKLVPGATVLKGDAATETAVKTVDAPVVLHVATHGFFLADNGPAGGDGTRGVTYVKGDTPVARPVTSENPLIRSGLAFAGANLRAGPDGEDGVLTALEVSSMNLRGTELVVLSACETGVGEVRNGDGVYGLRRALVIAGSRSQLMSLWQVDDEATNTLMTSFYKQLQRGKGRSVALQNVQRKMLRKKATAHPFYWAAFIPSGDPGEMTVEPSAPKPERTRKRRSRGSLDLVDYWGDKFDDPMITLGGSYLGIAGDTSFDGEPASMTRGFDLRLRGFLRPHVQVGFDYSRQKWEVPSSARELALNLNHLEFVLGIDVLPLPYEWRVRPALVPYAALGLAWGKQFDRPTLASSRSEDTVGGGGATFGADAILYVRPVGRFLVGLRGGVSKPLYRIRSDGERVNYDDSFPRALRWQVGIDIGVTP